jgi:hypothetical protein
VCSPHRPENNCSRIRKLARTAPTNASLNCKSCMNSAHGYKSQRVIPFTCVEKRKHKAGRVSAKLSHRCFDT